uniref:AMP-binding domain-containing protein n=1 Tax=Panagrellus redivivus TaxID=6233 RepID=A0A7E4VQ88_PANRE
MPEIDIDPLKPLHHLVVGALGYYSMTRPNETAFKSATDEFPEVTFKEVYDSILATANYYYNTLQLEKGDVVTISLPNTWHYVPAYIGASCVGAVVSGMNPRATSLETTYLLKDAKAKVVLTTAENVEKILGIKEDLPNLKYILYLGDLNNNITNAGKIRVIDFETVIAGPAEFNPATVPINTKTDLLSLPYSSGTTGMPKGVMITHFNFLNQLIILGTHLKDYVLPFFPQLEKQTRFQFDVQYLPFYHSYGFTGLIAKLIKGDTTVIMKEFNPDGLLRIIDEYKIPQVNLVPGLFDLICSRRSADYSLASLKSVACGGAALTPEQIEKLHERLPNLCYVLHGYGLTEASGASHMNYFKEDTPRGAVGQLLSFMKHRIVDPETQQEVGPEVVGELWIRGPTIMKGYWGNEEATKAAFAPDGFLKTGDLAKVDKQGYLYIIDRLKEVIKVNAVQVPPAEIEALLKQHPKIKDAAVIGVPHKVTGEAPRAYIVKNDDSLTVDEVNNFTQDKLSKYKQLTGGIEFVDEVLKNQTGKILRHKLKEAYLRRIQT